MKNDNVEQLVKQTLDEVWEKEIINKNTLATPNQKSPKGFILGGQPGAGKSNLINILGNELNKNAIVINGDDYRKYHPLYNEFQEKYTQDSPKYTAEFAGKMTEAIFQKALNESYNIIIEGTFRTTTTPIKTLEALKEKGYETGVFIQTCNPALSLASCEERYKKMLETNPKEARHTSKEHHNLVVSVLASNVQKISERKDIVDKLEIYKRTKNNVIIRIYPSKDKAQTIKEAITNAIGSLKVKNDKGLELDF